MAQGEGGERKARGVRAAVLALAMLALQAAPAQAEAYASATSTLEQPRPAALAFARVVNSEAIVLNNPDGDAKALPLMEAAMRDEMASMEKARPGITHAVAVAVLPIINRSARERLPELWRRAALLYGGAFDDAELETLTRFFDSSLGKRLMTVSQDVTQTDAIEGSIRRGRMPSIRSVMSDVDASDRALKAALTAEDRASLDAFEKTDIGKRLNKLDRRIAKLLIEWHGEQAPWEAVETERAVARVIAEYGSGKER